MRILFIFARPKAYDSKSVRELPCGGTEKAVIFLGEALQKLGHQVEWKTTTEQLQHYTGKPDAVITQIAELLEAFPNAQKIWWTHHFSDQPVIQANAAFGRCFADRIVTLSQCHAKDFKEKLRLDSVTIGHGVWLDEVFHTEKDPYRLIYASTPFRGLERIPGLFEEIKKNEPRATIAICSSMGTYGTPEDDESYRQLFDRLQGIPGVELLGALNQTQLYEQYAKASIFFYPCTWPETYCLAMDEAIAHGCSAVVPNIGALSERTQGCLQGREVDWVLDRFNVKSYTLNYFPVKDWLEIAKEWDQAVLN